MTNTPARRSYRDLTPREYGGEEARKGFDFQDHVTAGYCLDMLLGGDLVEVWCETLDDVTLVHDRNGHETYEFVQAKSNDLGKHWSVTDLCRRKTVKVSGKIVHQPGTSILEKSLANDAGHEPCGFRVVTAGPVDKELALLSLPLDAPGRAAADPAYCSLQQRITAHVAGFTSTNGRDATFWMSNVVWQVMYSGDAVQDRNLLKLDRLLELRAVVLFPDQRAELYRQLVGKVYEAAKAPFDVNPLAKRLTRDACSQWLQEVVDRARFPGAAGKGMLLRQKLDLGGLGHYQVTAREQQMYYLMRRRNPGYLNTFDAPLAEAEAQRALTRLNVELDRGNLTEGPEFLAQCDDILQGIAQRLGEPGTGLPSYLTGFMYNLADRCVFRFRKAGP
ncbi:dsDNA nuclease domain-containing protein [Deinococcus budaensis]|uniref:CD-NTase associated protein 4-like DNA endonuclease domain-containing protein n=1 Tax=Deinococcus budaensis TaxID=1665626 RepID=A0A7W8GEI9_9DEIO|nr:dsDNA nuclease domain-containing protein [Deinococcus budaensis]MBB5234162.1 hypothetical protein [Deinococcus budaensis]